VSIVNLLVKVFSMLALGVALAVGLPACEKKGPAEKAGEKIDKAVEDTKEGVKDAGKAVPTGVKETGEKLEEAGKKLQTPPPGGG
jgi:hypothetical protein